MYIQKLKASSSFYPCERSGTDIGRNSSSALSEPNTLTSQHPHHEGLDIDQCFPNSAPQASSEGPQSREEGTDRTEGWATKLCSGQIAPVTYFMSLDSEKYLGSKVLWLKRSLKKNNQIISKIPLALLINDNYYHQVYSEKEGQLFPGRLNKKVVSRKP